jgi:VanZ family protein
MTTSLARLVNWGPASLWMGLIFYLSSRSTLPAPKDPLWHLIVMKTGHALVYAILAYLYRRALHREGVPRPRGRRWALILALLYAASDEAHQGLVPGRTPALYDWLIDAGGALLGLLPPLRSPSPRAGPGAE